jgi:uncharacterized membrane protein YphA (DoxX/SURF4 family)
VLLAVILLSAGVQKLADPNGFATTIGHYRLLPANATFLAALYLPNLETLLGVCLLFGFFSRSAASLSALLSGLFAVAVGSAIIRGLDIECGCFSGATRVSWMHVLLDLSMLCLSILVVKRGAGRISLDYGLGPGEGRKRFAIRNKIPLIFNLLLLCVNVAFFSRVANPYVGIEKAPDARLATKPPVRFARPVLDLGHPNQGKVVHGSIVYRNISDRVVHIDHSEASCGCTEGTYNKSTLRPGESGIYTVGFNTGAKQGPSRETVRLLIKESKEPALFEVHADVQPLFTITPLLLRPRTGDKMILRMSRVEPGAPFQIKSFESPLREIKLRVLGYPTPGVAEFEFSLSGPLSPPTPPSEAWRVGVQTDVDGLPPIYFYVAPPKGI